MVEYFAPVILEVINAAKKVALVINIIQRISNAILLKEPISSRPASLENNIEIRIIHVCNDENVYKLSK